MYSTFQHSSNRVICLPKSVVLHGVLRCGVEWRSSLLITFINHVFKYVPPTPLPRHRRGRVIILTTATCSSFQNLKDMASTTSLIKDARSQVAHVFARVADRVQWRCLTHTFVLDSTHQRSYDTTQCSSSRYVLALLPRAPSLALALRLIRV